MDEMASSKIFIRKIFEDSLVDGSHSTHPFPNQGNERPLWPL